MAVEEGMTAVEALKYASKHFGVPSYYAMSKALSDEELTVQPIQISNYAKGKRRMSEKVAQRFFDTFGIVISDAYRPGTFQR